MKGRYWTPEQDALLAKLWGRGKSATECAANLPGKTRNSCIGRAHRLHLDHGTARSGPVANLGAMSKATRLARHNAARRAKRAAEGKIPRPAPPERPLAPVAPAIEPPIGSGVRFAELEPHHCRWPLNTMCSDHIWKFCGEPRREGGPYCDHHHSRAFAGLRYQPRIYKPKENVRQFNG